MDLTDRFDGSGFPCHTHVRAETNGQYVTRTKKTACFGGAMLSAGLGVYLYVELFGSPYWGASGGGLSGLEAGLIVMGAMVLGGLGILLLLISLVIRLFRSSG